MKKTLLITGSSLLLALATAALLAVHPTLAKGEEAKSSGAEVKVDNFTFSPDTLTVPVNGAVTWVNKDDIPHVITSNDGLFKFKAWIQTKNIHTPSLRRALTHTTARSIPRWWVRSSFNLKVALIAVNPFSVGRVFLAKHAKHVVLIHFPIALFMTSAASA